MKYNIIPTIEKHVTNCVDNCLTPLMVFKNVTKNYEGIKLLYSQNFIKYTHIVTDLTEMLFIVLDPAPLLELIPENLANEPLAEFANRPKNIPLLKSLQKYIENWDDRKNNYFLAELPELVFNEVLLPTLKKLLRALLNLQFEDNLIKNKNAFTEIYVHLSPEYELQIPPYVCIDTEDLTTFIITEVS